MTSTATTDQIDDLDQVDLAVVDLALVERVAERWCATVDPALLSGADAASGAEQLAVVIRRYQAVQLLLARRAEACNAYAARAHSGADWLATLNGTSKAEAARALDTAKRLDGCPATKAAFSAGEISKDEADAVSGAAAADPQCEQRLLEGAKARHDLRETRTAADRARRAARSAEDEAARQARLHTTRSLRISESPEGHVEIRGRFTPAAFAGVKPVLDAHLKQRLDQARREGTRDGWDAYRADSFLAAIAAGAPRSTPTTRPTPTATHPSRPDAPAGPTVPGSTAALAAPGATATPAAAPTIEASAATPPAAPATPSAPTRPAADTATASPASTAGPASTSEPASTPGPASSNADPTTADGRLFGPGDEIATATGLDPKINWNLVILVDGIALKRGYAAPGETCEIPGIGPIPVTWIETLLPSVHTEMLIHDSVDIRAYATTTRHRTRPVDLAVRVRDRTCTVPRCHRDISELDHITDFADTHDTSVENLHGFCNANHDDKTYRDATFTRDHTNWNWWPPGTNPETTPPLTAPIGQHLTTWNLDHLPTHRTCPGDEPDHDPPPTLELT